MKKLLLFLFLLFLISGCSVSTDDDSSSGSSDGTADSPAELTVGTAKSGGIATNGYSYYKFTTSSTGAGSYKLEIASMTITDGWGTYAVSTNLYSDSGYTTSSQLDWDSCAASCTLNFDYENLDASKTYYLKLSGYGTLTYSLTVSRGGSEGSKNNPVELTLSTAHSGTIDNIDESWDEGNSYYKFTTSAADNYTMIMTNSDSLGCILYSDSSFSTSVGLTYNSCSDSTNLATTFKGSGTGISGSTSYYLRITGKSSTHKITTYNITVAPEG